MVKTATKQQTMDRVNSNNGTITSASITYQHNNFHELLWVDLLS